MAVVLATAVLRRIYSTLHPEQGTCAEPLLPEQLRAELALDRSYCNLNHGSFGTCPTAILKRKQQLLLQAEARPDLWYRVRAKRHPTIGRLQAYR